MSARRKIGMILTPEKFMTGALLMNRDIYQFLKNKIDIHPIIPKNEEYLNIRNIGTILYYFSAVDQAEDCDFIWGTSIATLGFFNQNKVIQHFHGVDSIGRQVVLDNYKSQSESENKVTQKWQKILLNNNDSNLEEVKRDIAISGEIEKICCQKAIVIIAVSPLVKKQLIGDFGVSSEKIKVILNGISDYWFENHDSKFVDDAKVIFVTRVSNSFYNLLEKGQDRAYEILSQLDNQKKIYSHLSTSNPREINEYKKVVENNTGAQIIIGKNREQLAREYRAGDIYLGTSRTEACQLTLIEAMACRMCPVTYSVGIVSDYIKNGINGFVVKSIKEAVHVIEKLSKDKKLRETIGNNAYFTAKENFTYDRMLDEYSEFISNVIKG